MRTYSGSLLEYADVEIGFELLQPDGARQSRRARAHDAHVVLHHVPFDGGSTHLGCILIAPSRRIVSPFNMGISKIAATICANSSGLPRRLGKGIWLAREACSSGLIAS